MIKIYMYQVSNHCLCTLFQNSNYTLIKYITIFAVNKMIYSQRKYFIIMYKKGKINIL